MCTDTGPVSKSCRFCGGAPAQTVRTREMMFGFRDPFTYVRCNNCGSLSLIDAPNDLSNYYADGYYSMKATSPSVTPSLGASLWTRVLLKTPAVVSDRAAGKRGFPIYIQWFHDLDVSLTSKIADIGSGEGHLILRMARHGFRDLWGLDPFISENRDVGPVHLRREALEAVDGVFDVIMFNHSLEHVPDPLQALKAARERLKHDGSILVRVPVAGSFADRHYGADWISLDPPRHFGVPSVAGMRIAAQSAGLRVVRIFFDSLPLQIWGSELYRRGAPLKSARGPDGDTREVRRLTRMLNRRGDGDMAGFVLQVA